MKAYEDLDDDTKQQLQQIAASDAYGLNPKTLYNNILYSTGDNELLSRIFEVPLSLVIRIKEEGKRG